MEGGGEGNREQIGPVVAGGAEHLASRSSSRVLLLAEHFAAGGAEPAGGGTVARRRWPGNCRWEGLLGRSHARRGWGPWTTRRTPRRSPSRRGRRRGRRGDPLAAADGDEEDANSDGAGSVAKREPRSSAGTSAGVALAGAMAGVGSDEARAGPRWTIPPSSSE